MTIKNLKKNATFKDSCYKNIDDKNSSWRGQKLYARKINVNTVHTCHSKQNLKAFNKTPILLPFFSIDFIFFYISGILL